MAQTRKIPILKPHLVIKQPGRPRMLIIGTVLACLLALMLLRVWLQVKTNECLRDIQALKSEKRQVEEINSELNARVIELSNFGRITEIAQSKLNLVFIPRDDIRQIPK